MPLCFPLGFFRFVDELAPVPDDKLGSSLMFLFFSLFFATSNFFNFRTSNANFAFSRVSSSILSTNYLRYFFHCRAFFHGEQLVHDKNSSR